MIRKICILIIILGLGIAHGQRILLVNGHLHPIEGQEITSSLIEIENGKIIAIKNALSNSYNTKEWDTVIDATNQHVYPGFVAANSTLGLTEIDAVRATNDFDEVGELNPHIRSQIAFNAESKVLETVKTNGVLLVQSTPRGGFVSGSSSIMTTGGWNWEDATVMRDDGIHVNWPNLSLSNPRKGEDAVNREQHYLKEVSFLSQFFKLASVYAEGQEPEKDLRLEAMKDCFQGSKRTYFHANDLRQLIDVLEFCKAFPLKFPVIVGGSDAYLLGQRLVDAKIPIMLDRIHRLPELDEDPIDLPYSLPALLAKMGVPFCLQNAGGMQAMNTRNLPFLAGTAQAYGLSELEALRSITLSPCEIMGLDQQFGSIEVGKSATLFVSKGPALDMRTNQVTTIIFNGKIQQTQNFQEDLYLKYQKKYKEVKN
ncbi:MAG: amidohydrolase family protein [Bacteroidota bacterium]